MYPKPQTDPAFQLKTFADGVLDRARARMVAGGVVVRAELHDELTYTASVIQLDFEDGASLHLRLVERKEQGSGRL